MYSYETSPYGLRTLAKVNVYRIGSSDLLKLISLAGSGHCAKTLCNVRYSRK